MVSNIDLNVRILASTSVLFRQNSLDEKAYSVVSHFFYIKKI